MYVPKQHAIHKKVASVHLCHIETACINQQNIPTLCHEYLIDISRFNNWLWPAELTYDFADSAAIFAHIQSIADNK